MIRVFQLRAKCIGCNACVEIAFERWRMSKKDGKSILLGATEKKGMHLSIVPNEEEAINRAAAKACPTHCIRVEVC